MSHAETYIKLKDGRIVPTLGWFGQTCAVILNGLCYCSEICGFEYEVYVLNWAASHNIYKIKTVDQSTMNAQQWIDEPAVLEPQMEIF